MPMLCEPIKWKKGKYGGFLLNSDPDFQNDLVTGSKQHSHVIKINNTVYNAVNYLNKMKFSIKNDY